MELTLGGLLTSTGPFTEPMLIIVKGYTFEKLISKKLVVIHHFP